MTEEQVQAANYRMVLGNEFEKDHASWTRRVNELLVANNAEVARRRGFEEEANQAHAEIILLRNECSRLRNALSICADHIEATQRVTDAFIAILPNEVRFAMDAIFPPPDASKPAKNAAEAILRRLHPYLESVNHIHLDARGVDVLYASEVFDALGMGVEHGR